MLYDWKLHTSKMNIYIYGNRGSEGDSKCVGSEALVHNFVVFYYYAGGGHFHTAAPPHNDGGCGHHGQGHTFSTGAPLL